MLVILCGGILIFLFKNDIYKPLLQIAVPLTKGRDTSVPKHTNLTVYTTKAIEYIAKNGYENKYCFFIDMRIPSGKKRFFVYDLIKDTISAMGLVTHGGGSEVDGEKLTFNNTPNAHATSLGKYKIGTSYNGKFGLAYKLLGMEPSNSHAFDRFVVLHAHSCVPDSEIHPDKICVSQGCPTVSPTFLLTLQQYIDKADSPILLWIFY